MTTTPNDAAVNAESAAKLVSECSACADVLSDRFGSDDVGYADIARAIRNLRNAANLIERQTNTTPDGDSIDSDLLDRGNCAWLEETNIDLENDGECGKAERRIKAVLQVGFSAGKAAARRIERHAAQQTQATHGEGEAVAFICEENLQSLDANFTTMVTPKQSGPFTIPLYTHPAPSPTAAPALGARFTPEQIQRATKAYNNACAGASTMEYCQQDCIEIALAAVLSGVAAQGDGLSITESEKRVTNSVVDNGRSTNAQGDGEARVSEEMVERACVAFFSIPPRNFNWRKYDNETDKRIKRMQMRAALKAALGVTDLENNHV